MIELGQLEKYHDEFDKRQTRIVAVSIENRADAAKTQSDYPHLIVVADQNRGLINALGVLHPKAAPDGSDTAAPTTFLIDRDSVVRWVFRPNRFVERLSPAELTQKIDRHLPQNRS